MKCCDETTTVRDSARHILLAGQPNAGKTSVFNALTGASQRVGNWPGVTVERKEGRSRFGPSGTTVIDIPGTYSLQPASLDEKVAREAIEAFPGAVIVNVVDASRMERQLGLTLELLALGRPMVLGLTMIDEVEAAGRRIDLDGLGEALGVPVLPIDGRTGKGGREVVEAALGARPPAAPAAASLPRSAPERTAQARALASKATRDAREGSDRGQRRSIGDLIDRVALSPLLGLPLFLLVVLAMFEATFGLGGKVVDLLSLGLDGLQALALRIPNAALASFVSGALFGGVGNVLLLLPYVFFMFLFLSFLEDSGYMARAVFATDALMAKLGLNGKSFIPLVMGFGCNVPAIMAVRSIESPRDRLRTILMVPFTSCSARLPVYAVVAGAFFGPKAGLVIFGLYVAGMAAGLATAALSSKFIPPEKGSGLVMELPPYRLPLPRNLLQATWNRSKGYLSKAGTVILAVSVLLWALSTFPWGKPVGESVLGLVGHAISPVFAPLGFDWRLALGLISGLAAKEVVVSTLALLAPAGTALGAALPAMMGPATALSFLVFVLLYTPCLATLAVMRSETGSRKWTAVSLGWSLFLAYGAALVVRLLAVAAGLAA